MTDDELPPSFYHVCFAVPDLRAAMDELADLVGVTWGEPVDSQLGDWPYTLVFSSRFPYFELVSSVKGSPWYVAKPQFHHLGWWSRCLSVTDGRWHEAGTRRFFDGRDHGRHFVYHDALASGLRLEAVDVSQQPAFIDQWAQDDEV